MRLNRQILALITAVSLFGVAAPLTAQQIDFHGAIIGCFYNTNPPFSQTSCSPSTLSVNDPFASAGGLNYMADIVTGTTSGDVGDNSVGFGTGPGGSFGHVNLFAGNYISSPGTVLELTFMFNPTFSGFFGPGTPTTATNPVYTAALKGNVKVDKSGNLKVDFGAPVTFAFTGGGHLATCAGPTPICGPGPYTGNAVLTINDLNAFYGQTNVEVTGQIEVLSSATPEPASLVLFATGIVGLVPAVRYRRKRAAKA